MRLSQLMANLFLELFHLRQQRFAKTPPSLPTSLKLRRSKKATAGMRDNCACRNLGEDWAYNLNSPC